MDVAPLAPPLEPLHAEGGGARRDSHESLVELRGVDWQRPPVRGEHEALREVGLEGRRRRGEADSPRRARRRAEVAPGEETAEPPEHHERAERGGEPIERREGRDPAEPRERRERHRESPQRAVRGDPAQQGRGRPPGAQPCGDSQQHLQQGAAERGPRVGHEQARSQPRGRTGTAGAEDQPAERRHHRETLEHEPERQSAAGVVQPLQERSGAGHLGITTGRIHHAGSGPFAPGARCCTDRPPARRRSRA